MPRVRRVHKHRAREVNDGGPASVRLLVLTGVLPQRHLLQLNLLQELPLHGLSRDTLLRIRKLNNLQFFAHLNWSELSQVNYSTVGLRINYLYSKIRKTNYNIIQYCL